MRRLLSTLTLLSLMLTLFVSATWAQMTPSVTVADQKSDGKTIMVGNVVSAGPGWIAIHESKADGTVAAPVIGVAALKDGENANVSVTLDRAAKEGEKFWAMLHTDTGVVGTYEFGKVEGADGPVLTGGEVVMKPFVVTLTTAPATGGAAPTTMPQSGAESSPFLPMMALVAGLALLGAAALLRPRLR